MVGCRGGVATLLKAHVPHLVSIHCVAHRLALATSHAAESVPYIKKYSKALQTIYAFYHRSSVRVSALHELQSILGDPCLQFKEPKSVCWLSHGRAVTAVRRCLPSLLASLEHEAADEPTTSGLLKIVGTYEFIACTYFISDILTSVNNLSLTFQKQNVDISIVQPCVQSTIVFLNSLKVSDGAIMKQLPKAIEDLPSYSLNPTTSQKEKLNREVLCPYIDQLVNNIKDRFPDVELLDAVQIFDPTLLPQLASESFLNHGFSQLQTLLAHYSPSLVDDTLTTQEWTNFLPEMATLFSGKSMQYVLSALVSNPVLSAVYPNISKLAGAALVFPMSTADCERGFSAMNRIKTDLRNSLKTQTLDNLMRITIKGKARDEFDFEKAANLWGSKRNRRLHIL